MNVLKLVIYPAIDSDRLGKIVTAAGSMSVKNTHSEVEALAEIVDAEAFLGQINKKILSAAHNLCWVQTVTASLENYIFPELIEHPCRLTNTRGLYSDVVADHAFGYLLCFARNFHIYIRRQMESRWEAAGGELERPSISMGQVKVGPIDRAHIHLGSMVLGIVGLGSIGSEIARRGLSCGMRVMAVDPVKTKTSQDIDLWTPERLPDLLSKSDFVVISAPHTPQTEKLFRRTQFLQMKRTAYLINVGRGMIVDLKDLTTALKSGTISGAGLDVFELEPLPAKHPLWKMENVIITPHVGSSATCIALRHLEFLLDNVARFSQGKNLRNLVDKEKWF